jgi:alkaline phosphatase
MSKTKNSKYVDGFVLVVPKKNVAAYRKMAKEGADIWTKYGALDYKECIGDDLDHGSMPMLNFIKLAKVKKSETVWFSFITYKSRAHRDQVNKKVMKEMEKKAETYKDMKMPFDMKRMAYGGFKVVVSN